VDVAHLGVKAALTFGLIAALVPGSACIQHYALRFVLWCQGAMPWRYVASWIMRPTG
jgi:hypothetical protein